MRPGVTGLMDCDPQRSGLTRVESQRTSPILDERRLSKWQRLTDRTQGLNQGQAINWIRPPARPDWAAGAADKRACRFQAGVTVSSNNHLQTTE
jgi:hypothetical protein